MIIKGKSCAGARRLAIHLTRVDSNERVELREFEGVAAEDLLGALLEMEAMAAGSNCSRPFYHFSMNTLAKDRLTEEQRNHGIDVILGKLGLAGQPRIVVVHEKFDGREHTHVAVLRVNLVTMRAISDSHNFRKHEEAARQLEREFGHERVQGVHIERDGKPRPERRPSHAEMQQAERTGLKPGRVKEHVTEIWRRTDNGSAFAVALWEAGYTLCRGDRRDFVVIDPLGGTHSLARCVDGAKTKEIRQRMSDLDPAHLPSVAQGREYSQVHRPIYLAEDQERLDREKQRNSGDSSQDWTHKGGMFEQQKSAMNWAQAARELRETRIEQTERQQVYSEAAEAAKQRRDALRREFGRDIDHELDPSDRERGQEQSRR